MAKQDILIGAVAGVAIAILVPVALLVAVGKRRPIMHALSRGGQLLSEKAQETLAECQEIVEDLVAEMRTPAETATATGAANIAASDIAADASQSQSSSTSGSGTSKESQSA